MVIAEKRLQNC